MIFNELNSNNFLLFAVKNYENPQAVTKEDFDKDLNHFKYIKRLLRKYKNGDELKIHLLLNHFIILYNIFGEATTPMLFFKIEKIMLKLFPAHLFTGVSALQAFAESNIDTPRAHLPPSIEFGLFFENENV